LPATAQPAAPGIRPVRGEQKISLTESVSAALNSIARQNGVTTNTVLQSAWALLLNRYTREEDVVFGVVRACRRSSVPAADAIVGLLINTVPLRVRIAPELSLATWLGSVRKAWRALRDFEHSPLAEIQGWSQVPRGQPLFETIFNYQDPSWDSALRAQGGKWEQREFGICSQSNYPLVVDAYGGGSLLIKILYQRTRFDDDTIARILGHFKTLLESMAASPEERVGQLPMLTEAERDQIMGRWNETRAECPQDKCAHLLFEEQAARTPQALAVADEQTRLTYAELDEEAGVIADELRRAGVGVDVCVGVCLERSTKMVVAKLAVWKAGGAYVPLDPSYPAERLKFMLEDAGMPVLLTQASLLGQLQFETAHLRVLCVDELLQKSKGRSKNRRTDGQTSRPTGGPASQVQSSSSLAYVIYTSGSTGRPKGVEIEHRSLVNLLTWHQRTYSVKPQDRATQIATPAFDASVWELWPYLTSGASIHIPDEATRLSPNQLVRWLVEKQITLAFIPTPIAEAMLEENWPDKCALRHLLTGGDRLHRPPPKSLPFPLSNHYGPTENTVVTTSTPVPPMDVEAGPPPIGRPVSNTQVYILDPGLLPVPVGVPGELWITGTGIARGYRNQPGLTRERFIPNPFGEDPNSRMYKTGDLVRWRPDGQIEFLGRLDHQVKIRGQRIELGEIESALSNQPDVVKAVVVPRENGRGELRLAAYVVPKNGAPWQPELLRKSLKQILTAAMMPAAFARIETLPLTPNGKVDNNALPAPDFGRDAGATFVAPRTQTEGKLSEIWSEVLGIARVGIHDSFFELGGHSLTATQVNSRILRSFGIELPLQDLFDGPTVAELSARIDAGLRGKKAKSVIAREHPIAAPPV
jgi:amino acid adenylation domain-containing protein